MKKEKCSLSARLRSGKERMGCGRETFPGREDHVLTLAEGSVEDEKGSRKTMVWGGLPEWGVGGVNQVGSGEASPCGARVEGCCLDQRSHLGSL